MYGIVFLLIPVSSLGFAYAAHALRSLFNFYDARSSIITRFFITYISHIIFIFFIIPALLYTGHLVFHERDVPTEHINAGLFIKNFSTGYETLNVMSRKPWASFYSDSRYTTLPYANSTDVITFARFHRADYIVIDERLLSKWEHYPSLMSMNTSSQDVELVYEDDSLKRIKIFKLKK